MSIIEFIGFVIAMGAMTFLFFKRYREERNRRLNPQEYARRQREQEEDLRKFLRSMNIDVEEEELEPPEPPSQQRPPPIPKQAPIRKPWTNPAPTREMDFASTLDHYKKESAIERRKLKTDIENRAFVPLLSGSKAESYEVIRRKSVSRGAALIQTLNSPQDMFIVNEIIGKPLSMRHPEN